MANPRRSTRRAAPTRPRPAAPAAAVAASAIAPTPQSELPPSSNKRVDWKAEYSYVVNDLRQLGIVTVGVFALLLIIGFFL